MFSHLMYLTDSLDEEYKLYFYSHTCYISKVNDDGYYAKIKYSDFTCKGDLIPPDLFAKITRAIKMKTFW